MKRAALLAAALACLIAAPPAPAAGPLSAPAPGTPGAQVTEAKARAIAAQIPKIAAVRRAHPGSTLAAEKKDALRWEVNVYTPPGKHRPAQQIGQVYVSTQTGQVLEAWTGFQVAWGMARGYPGAFGRSVNAPWIWVTLCVLFVLPFIDPRRPLRWLHADLLALVGFSGSLFFFNRANLGMSVPISSALLAYLLVRLLWVGLSRRAAPSEPLQLMVPWRWLGVATLFLIGFRAGLNMVDGNVIDVGYAGVIGADKLAHGRELYGAFPTDNGNGDTYGPLLYLSYVPFELIWPWHGRWDDLPAAHAAAAVFDTACIVLLFLIGRRLRGPRLGVVFAYAWAAFPFTIYATNSGTNDALPAALVLLAVYLHRRPFARGASIAAAGMAKFAPLALLPLFAAHGLRDAAGRGSPTRRVLVYCAGAGLVLALSAALVLMHTDPRTFWDRTVGYQAGRAAPFSVWGLYGGGWEVGQGIVQVGVVLLAAGIAFVPRRDDVVGLSALAAAILVARPARGDVLVLPLPRVDAPGRADRADRAPGGGGARHAAGGCHGTITCSSDCARSAWEHRMTTPFSHGSPSAVSNRTCICVTSDSIACSFLTPITPSRGPVIPTSVM